MHKYIFRIVDENENIVIQSKVYRDMNALLTDLNKEKTHDLYIQKKFKYEIWSMIDANA